MRRLFPMTPIAVQALTCSTTAGTHTPTQFLVDGDAKEGYEIYHVNADLLGFNMVKNDGRVKTFYAVQRIVEAINETGTPGQFAPLVDMRCFIK